MRTGLEDLVKVAIAMAAAPHVMPPMAQPRPTVGGHGLRNTMLGVGALGVAGLGAGLMHQHSQDVEQYPQVAPAMHGVY